MKNDDATLFMRADQVEAAWRLFMPVLEAGQRLLPVISQITPQAHGGRRLFRARLAEGHSWPLPNELLKHYKKKVANEKKF